MLFYKGSLRSTVLDRPEHAANDHDSPVESEGFIFEDDCYLAEIARAARAEADAAAPATPAPAPKDKRLSTFESELLAAWTER